MLQCLTSVALIVLNWWSIGGECARVSVKVDCRCCSAKLLGALELQKRGGAWHPKCTRAGVRRHLIGLATFHVQGGATCFDHLGLCIQPKQGKVLLFFPATSDGQPDARCAVAGASGLAGWIAKEGPLRRLASACLPAMGMCVSLLEALPLHLQVHRAKDALRTPSTLL